MYLVTELLNWPQEIQTVQLWLCPHSVHSGHTALSIGHLPISCAKRQTCNQWIEIGFLSIFVAINMLQSEVILTFQRFTCFLSQHHVTIQVTALSDT